MRKFRFVTVGLGPVGRALTAALQTVGHEPVWVIGRGHKVEKALAKQTGAKHARRFPKNVDNIDFILLTLPTSKLAAYASELSAFTLPWRKLTILHASGSLGISPLMPLAKRGAGVAAMHPYQTFPKKQAAVHLTGITYGITGNRRGAPVARKLARALGGHPISLREKDRLLYHLSAIVACTFVASNLETAIHVLKSLGIDERRAKQAVLSIAGETIRNVSELGIRDSMTGPQTRGDTALIQRHVTELRKRLPELADLYGTISRFIMKTRGNSHK